MHPEEVAKSTGHRDVKTMYDNYYTQSKRRRKMQTVVMMGGIQDGKWDEEGVPAVMTREPLVKTEEKEAKEVIEVDDNTVMRSGESRVRLEFMDKLMRKTAVKVSTNLFDKNKENDISYNQIFQNQQCLWRESNELMKEFFNFMSRDK